jgi:protein phosphatase-4 regulatory subunit 3
MKLESTPEHKVLGEDTIPRRVKVYLLQGDDWLDNGTGFCIGEVDPETNSPYFVVRNELDETDVILKSFLNGNIQYQRQQETLIVWTDLSGKDLALSFQEIEGCADICDFIMEMQQSMCPDISLYYVIPAMDDGEEITELIIGPVTYPEFPTISNLEQILEVITLSSNAQFTRSKIAAFVVENDYLLNLIDVLNESERVENINSLHSLHEIVKSLFLYNDTNMIEYFLSSEENIIGLVGMLEYDPEYPNFRTCHREFLKNKAFKTVVLVDSLEIFKKDFHLNFLKDVVLARFLDDQTYNLISSLIYMNQVEIINYFKDSSILQHLFGIYDHENKTNLEQKRNGIRMLHQYVLIAKSLQSYQKSEFFLALVKAGLFKMINFALIDDDARIRVLGTELIVIIIEQDVSLVNTSESDVMDESSSVIERENSKNTDEKEKEKEKEKLNLSKDMTLISILSRLLMEDKNPGLKMQAFEALKILLDPNIVNSSGEENNGNMSFGENGSSNSHHNDPVLSNYFKAFYNKVAPKLFSRFIDLSNEEKRKMEIDNNLCQHLCALITFCLKEHDPTISRKFFLDNDVIRGMSMLLIMDCKLPVKLGVIRCLKHIILQDNPFYCRYIIHEDIMKYFFMFFRTVILENNLANSTCLDCLDIILHNSDVNSNLKRRHNFKSLANYIYKNYKNDCQNIPYVDIGKKLIELVEQDFNDASTTHTDVTQNSLNSDDDIDLQNVSTPINEYDAEDDGNYVSDREPKNIFENIDTKTNDKANKSDEAGRNKRPIDLIPETPTNGFNGSPSSSSNLRKKIALGVPSPGDQET